MSLLSPSGPNLFCVQLGSAGYAHRVTNVLMPAVPETPVNCSECSLYVQLCWKILLKVITTSGIDVALKPQLD